MAASVTTDITNYTRIYLILVKGGTLLTKTLFIKRANDLSLPLPGLHGLSQQQVVDQFLCEINRRNAILSTTTGRNYRNKIYPPTGTTNLEDFDLYLFCFILIQVCQLPLRNKNDVEFLKRTRNDVSHCHEPSMCEDDFTDLLTLIKEVFERTLLYINNPLFTDEMNLFINKYEKGPLAIDEIVTFYHEVSRMFLEINENLTTMVEKQDYMIQNQSDMLRNHQTMLQNENMMLQNSNTQSAKLDDLLAKLTNLEDRLPPGTPVDIPEIEVIVELENLAIDKQEELLEHLETDLNRAISNPNETLITVEREPVSKSVFETVQTLLSKGWKLIKARRKCLLLTFKSRSISSFVSLINGCIDGSLQKDLQGLEETIRGLEGCADVKFTIIVTQDKIIEAIYTLVKNLDDKVPNEMPMDSLKVHEEQSESILKSSFNSSTAPTNDDLSTAPHLRLRFKPTVVQQSEFENCVQIEHEERELKQIQNEIRNEPDFASVEIKAKNLKLDGQRTGYDKGQQLQTFKDRGKAKMLKENKKKTKYLCRYTRRTHLRKTNQNPKRKFQKTPIKSPYKSPLYKIFKSPATKRLRSTSYQSRRKLFQQPENQCTAGTSNTALEEEFSVLSSTLSVSDDEHELVENLPDDSHVVNEQSTCMISADNVTCTSSEIENNIQKMKNLLPVVMDNLSKCGVDDVMTSFFEMVAAGTYPLDNIAFLLWAEVVKWFNESNTIRMRYSAETKRFWKLGWRLFGRRFLNFMGGFKSHGALELNTTKKGKFDPGSSEINFVVPDVNVLCSFDPYDTTGARYPGIYKDTILVLSQNLQQRSSCLTFDGKKIKQGLTQSCGDVDLLGHENGLTLAMKRIALEKNIEQTKKLEECILQNTKDGKTYLDITDEIIRVLQSSFTKLSEKVTEVMNLKCKKSYCKKKLIERSGQLDWRKGRYAFAISSVTAFIHELDEFVNAAKVVLDQICRHIAGLNGEKYVDGNHINLRQSEKYLSIEEQQITEEKSSVNTRLVQQRSQKWHDIRSEALVTGSTLYAATGCDGLAKQKDHFENVICGVTPKEPPETTKQAMKHGIDNEINAVGTVIGKVMPMMTPGVIFCEEGCVVVTKEDKTFLVVSPDGSLRKSGDLKSTEVAIEIKCQTKAVHTSFPERYLLQCLAEIFALDVQYLLYLSWTEDVTTVFKVPRNDILLERALAISMDVYGVENPRKPTKLTQATKDLKEDIRKGVESVKFIGMFPSCKVSDDENTYAKDEMNSTSLCQLLADICKLYEKCYELQRERASEAVVFLIGDLDRSLKRNTIRCSPVGWLTKGYSLDVCTMRKIAEEVHTVCSRNGIHVPCEAFDGQWHNLVVRDAADHPLTLLQLQKDVWKFVEQKNKKEIIDELKKFNKTYTWNMIMDKEHHSKYISVTNGGVKFPQYRKVPRTNSNKSPDNSEDVVDATLIDAVPDIVFKTTDIGTDVLAITNITSVLEMEAFSHNVDIEQWSYELHCDDNGQFDDNDDLPNEEQRENVDEKCTARKKLDFSDMECILSLFKTTKDCNKKQQWTDLTPVELLEYFKSYENLSKLLDVEIRVIVRYLKKTKGMANVKESSTKRIKLDGIAKFLGMDLPQSTRNSGSSRRPKNRIVNSLQSIATNAVSKYSKQELNIILAEIIFPEKYQLWKKPIEHVKVDNETQEWFYKPEYSARREQLEVKCINSTNLLTRTRRKTCAGGIQGITNYPWRKVAKQKKTMLTPIMVEGISDPMSVSLAKTHFSESVELEMRKNGDKEAADLCKDIRSWWESEDAPGISAASRIQRRLGLRSRLIALVDFKRFPPPTQYVCGWPIQLWEALLANIDAKTYLYAMVHGGTYNVRAFSSLIGETFFSEVTLNDKRGKGTISAMEFSQYMGHSTEQLQVRLDQDRHFSYCRSKCQVYDVVDESYEYESSQNEDTCRICRGETGSLPASISIRNHHFDATERKLLADENGPCTY